MTKFGCNIASSTINRGVEAKEVELANTRLDRTGSECSSSSRGVSSALAPDASGSYVQVVVQKQGRGARSPRLPAASSPVRQSGETAGAGDGNVLLLPASVLLACQQQQQSLPQFKIVSDSSGGGAAQPGLERTDAPRGPSTLQPVLPAGSEKITNNSTWKILHNAMPEGYDSSENVPDRVEVYYFERCAGAFLATSGGRRASRVETARRRAASAVGAVAAELLDAAHLLLAAPAALFIGLQRCVLMAARDSVTGVVQTAADYALKPALTLTFNALLQPPLVFCANLASALREVARPLALLAGDALEPAARVLGALRLVSVRMERAPCRCQV